MARSAEIELAIIILIDDNKALLLKESEKDILKIPSNLTIEEIKLFAFNILANYIQGLELRIEFLENKLITYL